MLIKIENMSDSSQNHTHKIRDIPNTTTTQYYWQRILLCFHVMDIDVSEVSSPEFEWSSRVDHEIKYFLAMMLSVTNKS
jgi:hypothetical protein